MEKLTKTQQRVFDYIKEVIDARGVAPSVREIGAAVGLRSTSTVQYNLNALEKAGYIERDSQLKRTIRIVKNGIRPYHVPLLGTVTAGMPILAVESIEDYIPVPIAPRGRELFALRVRGDSMINAAILDGDIAVIEQTPTAENGEIVVALIDDEATLKRFYKEDGHFRLQPENDSYAPIIVDELAILGRLVYLIRNYEG
ncbi:MAG: transcriptional repressor LexA [Eubacterium sp.]|nr:transcriptional repressor LexA [Eubacterium sp.]